MNHKEFKVYQMARDICPDIKSCNSVCIPTRECTALKYAEKALDAGYSKQSVRMARAAEELVNIDTFCILMCKYCKNKGYCHAQCGLRIKARIIGFEKIVACYVLNDGDFKKVKRFIKKYKVHKHEIF